MDSATLRRHLKIISDSSRLRPKAHVIASDEVKLINTNRRCVCVSNTEKRKETGKHGKQENGFFTCHLNVT